MYLYQCNNLFLLVSFIHVLEADMAAREWLIFLQESDINREIKPQLESLLGNFISCTNSKQKALNLLKILDANFVNSHIIPVKVSYILNLKKNC